MTSRQRTMRVAAAVLVAGLVVILALLVKRGIRRPASPVGNAAADSGDALKAPVGRPENSSLSAPTLLRVAMLPVRDRTTVVAEFSGPLIRAEEVESANGTVTIEVGPVQPGVRPED